MIITMIICIATRNSDYNNMKKSLKRFIVSCFQTEIQDREFFKSIHNPAKDSFFKAISICLQKNEQKNELLETLSCQQIASFTMALN